MTQAEERIQKTKISDQLFERLQIMLAQGDWQPGDKIPSENELQARFQVSRVSVREALKRLESCGIIETCQGKGRFLRKFEEADLFESRALAVHMTKKKKRTIKDMLELLRIIELESVYLAAQRATPEDIGKLEENYREMLDSRADIERFADYDFAFHAAVAGMTGNTILIRCYSMILQCLREYFNRVVEKIGVEKGSYYHGQILEALKKGDAQEAREWMRRHLEATARGYFQPEQPEKPEESEQSAEPAKPAE